MKGYMYVVLRLMYQDDSEHRIETVGFHVQKQIPLINYVLARTHGIFLVTGATGHGKSKTIQAFLERYAERRGQAINVITVEDPTEYNIRGEAIVQTPLYYNRQEPDSDKKAWVLAIKQALRLDPDVIAPGELRDLPSSLAAVEAALTGHLVASTLHVYEANATLERLRNLGVPSDTLFNPAVFVGMMNQSLVAKACPDCSVLLRGIMDASGNAPAEAIDPDTLSRLKRVVGDLSSVRVRAFDGAACTTCKGSRVKGRIPAIEVIVPNAGYMERYHHEGALAAKLYWIHEMGGFTKVQHMLEHVANGLVDPATAEIIIGPLDIEVIELGQAVVAA